MPLIITCGKCSNTLQLPGNCPAVEPEREFITLSTYAYRQEWFAAPGQGGHGKPWYCPKCLASFDQEHKPMTK